MVLRNSQNFLIFQTEYNVRGLSFYRRCVNIYVFGDVMHRRLTGNKLPFGRTIMSQSSESKSVKGPAPFFDWLLKMEELTIPQIVASSLTIDTWSHPKRL